MALFLNITNCREDTLDSRKGLINASLLMTIAVSIVDCIMLYILATAGDPYFFVLTIFYVLMLVPLFYFNHLTKKYYLIAHKKTEDA
mmetsp:Transcript_22307/g.34514  ORF Transcript_22307/g.34514 Transcript_22307/m.34514 type:complete len:87 (+) Transcript_22307:441-701(+)